MIKKFIILIFFVSFNLFLLVHVVHAQDSNSSIKFLFVGDVMLNRVVKKRVGEKMGGDYFKLFQKVNEYLKSFDYVVANLEGPVSSKGIKVGSIYSFRMDPQVLTALQRANIKVFNLANNHMFDYGIRAFEDTLDNLNKKLLFFYGGGENSYQAYAPFIVSKNGVKIGILGFSDFLNHLEAKNDRPGVAIVGSEKFFQAIREARKKVDILIVTFHWGEEYQFQPTARQKKFAYQTIDSGADLIIGHHPHIIQKIEVYKNKFIFYSLGNFIFDQSFSRETMMGGLVEVEIKDKKIKNIYFRKSFLNNNFQVEKISEPYLVYKLNDKVLLLKIADEPQEWETGLMFIRKPIDYDGMIFIFPEKNVKAFWNKNTFVDLDVYWLDGEKIIGKSFLPSLERTKDVYTVTSLSPVNRVIEVIR